MFATIDESAFRRIRPLRPFAPASIGATNAHGGHGPAGRNEDRRRPPRVSISRPASPSYKLRSPVLTRCAIAVPHYRVFRPSKRGKSCVLLDCGGLGFCGARVRGGFGFHGAARLLGGFGFSAVNVAGGFRFCSPARLGGFRAFRARRPATGVADWRNRMGGDDAKTIYKERAATAECANAQARNRGLTQHGQGQAIALWHALTPNMVCTWR